MKQLFTAVVIILIFSSCTELVGFFLGTITTAAPQTTTLFLPGESEKEDNRRVRNNSDSILTLLLTANKVYYYTGNSGTGKEVNTISYKAVRNMVGKHKKMYGDKIVVVIKPHQNCSYKNTVDILDEMTINDIKKYSLVDLSTADMKFLGDITVPSRH
jgi:biopolymer transport protein ExbD